MYAIRVEANFSSAHSITVAGVPEPLHGHNWHVTVDIAAPTLDDDGLLVDFHTIHDALNDTISPFHNRTLNDVEPFNHLNPTAELIARHIAIQLDARVGSALRAVDARITAVAITEAPGCTATYHPDPNT
ncbi:MAG: 6-carboxytetrahydropterin synthase [Planctomycetota bacterium]